MTRKVRKQRRVSPFARAVGARMRTARNALKISQGQLSERLDVTPQQIHHYETGNSNLCGERIVTVCKALQVHPNHLLGWEDPPRVKERPRFLLLGRGPLCWDYDGWFEQVLTGRSP